MPPNVKADWLEVVVTAAGGPAAVAEVVAAVPN